MSVNPNPSRITAAIWDLWTWFDQLEPTVALGGIFAAKGGYHDIRNGHSGDYSVAEVSTDREGPGDKASALDLTMSAEAMRRYTTRLDGACRRRDERLFIGGQAVLREFIGTKDSRSVYCYVLVGGRARGLSADSSPDYGRDSSHLWHIHLSIIRKFAASGDAADRIYSILAGESLSAWKARRGVTSTPTVPQEEEEDMPEKSFEVPRGYAFASDGNTLIDRSKALAIGTSSIGLKGHPFVAGKKLFLSLGSDLVENSTEKVRVAIHNGSGWDVETYIVKDGDGRFGLKVPAAGTDSAFKISVARVAPETPEGEDPSEGDGPIFLLVEIR